MSNNIDKEIILILKELTSETTEVKTEIKHLSELMKQNHNKIEVVKDDLKKAEERLELKVEELENKLSEVKGTLEGRISTYEKFQFKMMVTSASFITVIGIVMTIIKFGDELKKLIGS